MQKIIEKIKDLYNKYKYSLFSGIIFTFITHLYYFTKRLGNEDDLGYLIFKDSALTSGRWYNGTLISTSVMSPILKFIIVIFIMSIISVLISDIFEIKSKKKQIILSLIISTFPTLAIAFSYLFMVEVYMISLLLSVLSLWIYKNYKYGYLIGSLCIALSLGCYQSYIGVTVGLIILYIIKELLTKKDIKTILKETLKMFIMGIIGVFLYFIILKIILSINNTTLSEYKGANKMGIPPINLWLSQIIRTYKHFIGYLIGQSFFKTKMFESIIRISIVICTGYLLIKKIIKEKIYKNKQKTIILIILISLIPFGFNIVDFMAYNTELTSLQIFQYSIFFILPILLIGDNNKKYINAITILLLIIYSYLNFITINKYYYKVETYYNYTVNLNNRLLSRIESTEGYYENIPIMFVGNTNSSFYKELNNLPNIEDTITFDQAFWGGKYIGYIEIYTFNNDKKIFQMIKNEFGVELNMATTEEKNEVIKTKEYKNMTSYPNNNSIKIINGIMVVNF